MFSRITFVTRQREDCYGYGPVSVYTRRPIHPLRGTQARPNHYQLTSPHGTNGQPRHDGADANLTVNVNPGSLVQDIVVIINVRDLNCNDLFVIRR